MTTMERMIVPCTTQDKRPRTVSFVHFDEIDQLIVSIILLFRFVENSQQQSKNYRYCQYATKNHIGSYFSNISSNIR
jgi:hypothetical protein